MLNQIILGDAIDTMRHMETGSVGVVVTSPPYNLRNSSGNGMKAKNAHGKWTGAALGEGYDGHEDQMPHAEYVEWQRECLSEMMRVVADDGVIFYNHKWRVQNGLLQDRSEIVHGFPVRQIIIWRRKGGFNFNPGYFVPTYEVIYMIAKPKFRLADKANALGDVWEIRQERNNPHPAPFPLELAKRCISATNADVVLDPFIGSGTTAVAARELGRNFIGIDRSEKYVQQARLRVAEVNA